MYGRKSTQRKSTKKPVVKRVYRKRVKTIPVVSKTLKRYIASAINKNIETNQANGTPYQAPLCGYDASGSLEIGIGYPSGDLGNIVNGAEEGQRIGDNIRLKKWIIKGFISPQQFDTIGGDPPTTINFCTENVVYAHLYVGRRLDCQPITNDNLKLDFFMNGSVNSGINGTYTDDLLPINRNAYKIYHHRRMKLGTSNFAGNLGGYTGQLYNNNDFKLTQHFTLDLCRYQGLKNKKLHYGDGQGMPDDAVASQIYIWCVVVNADMSNLISTQSDDVPNYSFHQLTYLSNIYYTDA